MPTEGEKIILSYYTLTLKNKYKNYNLMKTPATFNINEILERSSFTSSLIFIPFQTINMGSLDLLDYTMHKQAPNIYLVCPHKPTCIAKGPWPFRSTSHHWCRLLTDATVPTAEKI